MKTIALAILTCLPVFAVGTVGVSINPVGPQNGPGGQPENRIHVITITWVGDSITGTVPSTVVNVSQFPQLSGYRLVSIEIQPGTPSPSTNYSITLADAAGIDLLAGNGANLSATVASYTGSLLSPPMISSPTFALSGNSVASAKGTVTLYFAPVSQVAALRGLPATLPGNNVHTGANTFTGAVSQTAPGVFTNTQQNQNLQVLVNSCNPTTEISATGGQFQTEGITGCVSVPSTSTAKEATPVQGYVANSSTSTNGVGGNFQARCLVNSANCWGGVFITKDVTGLSTGGNLFGIELDLAPTNNPNIYVNPIGVSSVMASTFGTPGSSVGTAFLASRNQANVSWFNGFQTANGAVSNSALSAGATCTSGSCGSQPISMVSLAAGSPFAGNISSTVTATRTYTFPDATGTVPFPGLAQTWTGVQSYGSGAIVPSAAGGTDLGSTALPFGNLWLGTAATNNFKFQPATVGGQRIISIPDPVANSNLTLTPCITSQRSESAADANLLTCATPAVAGSYRIRFVLAVSAANAATLGWTASWTDSNGTGVTPTNLGVWQQNVGVPAATFTVGGPTELYGSADIDVNNGANNIVVKLTFSGTSFTAKATATVEKII